MTEEKKRRHRFSRKAIIKLLVQDNPKRKDTLSYTRFALYRDGMTIAEYVAAGGRSGDIKHDVNMKHIAVEVPQA